MGKEIRIGRTPVFAAAALCLSMAVALSACGFAAQPSGFAPGGQIREGEMWDEERREPEELRDPAFVGPGFSLEQDPDPASGGESRTESSSPQDSIHQDSIHQDSTPKDNAPQDGTLRDEAQQDSGSAQEKPPYPAAGNDGFREEAGTADPDDDSGQDGGQDGSGVPDGEKDAAPRTRTILTAPPEEPDAAPPAAHTATAEVENNGGAFIRVRDRIYFRKYGPDALDHTAVFGDFLASYHIRSGASEIQYYDTLTGRIGTAFPDSGYGGLYYVSGGFLLQEREDGADRVVWFSEDGAETRNICDGVLLGLTDSGLMAVENSGYFGGAYQGNITLLKDDEIQNHYQAEDGYWEYAGITEEGLFFLQSERVTAIGVTEDSEEGNLPLSEDMKETDSGVDAGPDAAAGISAIDGTDAVSGPDGSEEEHSRWSLWQLRPEPGSAPLCLGSLPETETVFSGEVSDFLDTGRSIGVVLGYYAGTGHFLNDYEAFRATPGIEDSLSLIDRGALPIKAWELPRLTTDLSGEPVVADHVPGELAISAGEWDGGAVPEDGDLRLYNGIGWQTLRKALAPSRTAGRGYERIVQTLDYVDGAAYVALACVHASPLDDVGWRSAYTLLDMVYLQIPAAEEQGQERELASVDYGVELRGNVWLMDSGGALLWQQTAEDVDPFLTENYYVFLEPISPAAEWEDGRAGFVKDASFAEPDGEADYYGYPVPYPPPGTPARFRLDRDGNIVWIAKDKSAAVSPMPGGMG